MLFTGFFLFTTNDGGTSEIEWKGHFKLGGTKYFSLYDISTERSRWMNEGEEAGGLKVIRYDRETGTLKISNQGEKHSLSLGAAQPRQFETVEFLRDLDNPEFAEFIDDWMALVEEHSYWRKEESIFSALRARARLLHNEGAAEEPRKSPKSLHEKQEELYEAFRRSRDFVLPRLLGEEAFSPYTEEELKRMLLFRVYGGRPLALPQE
ncbi:MAG: DUF1764 domain-containing protein [Opitutales bacterium]|nr:DUF1764 domain-containing protein [Opitutales bacterium]